jgi:uncharacterized ferritin-like protein (DUF455 family)
MSKLAEHIRTLPSRRHPPYRPVMTLSEEERAQLAERLGDAENYDTFQLREMVQMAPENLEFRKALVSAIVSAEFAGIDAFSRKVCEWQDWDVPWSLILATARQTWDEVRHAQLGMGLIESYGGEVGEYPDTLAGGGGQAQQNNAPAAQAQQTMTQSPIGMLSAVNVSLEGGALALFRGMSELGDRIGDDLMEHCFDYNWADEVTHTMIGDYFVRLLCRDNPEAERQALRAHAFSEFSRARLTEEQSEELKAFFAEEMQRAQMALGGQGGYQQ